MAYFLIFLVVLAVILWTCKDQVIALVKKLDRNVPKTGTTVPNPGMEAKAPFTPPATVPGTTIPYNGILAGYLGGSGGGNGTPSQSNFDPRTLISDGTVLDASTKFRTPPGVKSFTCPVKPGNYFIDGAECWGGLKIVVKRADGSVIGADFGGTPQVAWKQEAEETLVVETNYSGTNTDAGIKLHPSA